MNFNDFKIGFIGAGRVGVGLGAYFLSKGLQVIGYASRNPVSAEKAAEITSTSHLQCRSWLPNATCSG